MSRSAVISAIEGDSRTSSVFSLKAGPRQRLFCRAESLRCQAAGVSRIGAWPGLHCHGFVLPNAGRPVPNGRAPPDRGTAGLIRAADLGATAFLLCVNTRDLRKVHWHALPTRLSVKPMNPGLTLNQRVFTSAWNSNQPSRVESLPPHDSLRSGTHSASDIHFRLSQTAL
jgi:hypothetical protein